MSDEFGPTAIQLRAHIDALQAENERLREVVVASNTDSLAIMRIAEARITLLEGLLRRARPWVEIAMTGGGAVGDEEENECADYIRRIDAALSRSDAPPSAVSAARTASGLDAASE